MSQIYHKKLKGVLPPPPQKKNNLSQIYEKKAMLQSLNGKKATQNKYNAPFILNKGRKDLCVSVILWAVLY
jgi:hypothetical protein